MITVSSGKKRSVRLAAAMVLLAACADSGTAPDPPPPPPPNRPPAVVGAIPSLEVAAGETADVEISSYFTDPDGDRLDYAAVSSQGGVVSTSASGSVVTVSALSRGSATVTVTARDPGGLEASQSFGVTVPNRGPETTGPLPDLELARGDEVELDVSSRFTDPDGDTLSYRAATSDFSVVTARSRGNVLVLGAVAGGTATITVTAADPAGLEAALAFEVTVPNSGPEPAATMPDLDLGAGTEARVELAPHFSDPDGDALAYRAVVSDPAVAEARADEGGVTVRALARGSATVTFTAT